MIDLNRKDGADFDEPNDDRPHASMDGGSDMDHAYPNGDGAQRQGRNAVSVFENPTSRRDWPTALLLVERAASVIKDYQCKMATVEQDARSFVQRVDEEQARYISYIAALEKRLADQAAATAASEAAAKTMKTELWHTKLENDDLRQNLSDAQDEIRKYRDYIVQIETMLGNI